MDHPAVLAGKIHELQEEQRVLWRHLAESSLTAFERREVINQLRHSNSKLRPYLELMSERVRFRIQLSQENAGGFGKPNFRFLLNEQPSLGQAEA
jgi:hypothetical protein